jgi:hypothetical protein
MADEIGETLEAFLPCGLLQEELLLWGEADVDLRGPLLDGQAWHPRIEFRAAASHHAKGRHNLREVPGVVESLRGSR